MNLIPRGLWRSCTRSVIEIKYKENDVQTAGAGRGKAVRRMTREIKTKMAEKCLGMGELGER